ncbi:MAG: hypothetical protein HY765_01995, partial [Rhodomicrobium sp.]|nr:hypothetical protein [Rhodomicrobium sp.]
SLREVSACFDTKLFTTSHLVRMPFVEHIEFDSDTASESAKRILTTAIGEFRERTATQNKRKGVLPGALDVVGGAEKPIEKLAGFSQYSVKPLVGALGSAIKSGEICGIAGLVGCANLVQDVSLHAKLAEKLVQKDVLILATGCSAFLLAREGLASKGAVERCGSGLRKFCTARSIPPVLIMGSCVNNSRIFQSVLALCGTYHILQRDAPVVLSAPTWLSEKSLAIATFALSQGLVLHLGFPPPVTGSDTFVVALGEALKGTGGHLIIEADPGKASELMVSSMEERKSRIWGGSQPIRK